MSEIRRLRAHAGLTQAELSAATGISQPNLSAYENGRRVETVDVVERVRQAVTRRPSELLAQHRGQIIETARRHHGSGVRVFGSVADRSDGPESDLDLLVTFDDGATLLDLAALRDDLESLLGCTVDVVADDESPGPVARRIQESAVPV